MSAGPLPGEGGGGGRRGGGSQDFELNIASIIDCFTVLIAFMLVSASFISIGVLDAGISAAGEAAKTDTPPPSVNISVELGTNYTLTVKVDGKVKSENKIAAKDGKWDYERLTQELAGYKQKFPEVNALTLTADNSTEYKDVVKAMEVSRKTLPAVLLGGF